MRIIADHARTMTFLVNDGVVPSNEGGATSCDASSAAPCATRSCSASTGRSSPTLVTATIDAMGDAYPDLRANARLCSPRSLARRRGFRQTLQRGMRSSADRWPTQPTAISGAVAFRLHDTYGFPIEVTQEIAEERGADIDIDGFDAAMAEQRQPGRRLRKAAPSRRRRHET